MNHCFLNPSSNKAERKALGISCCCAGSLGQLSFDCAGIVTGNVRIARFIVVAVATITRIHVEAHTMVICDLPWGYTTLSFGVIELA